MRYERLFTQNNVFEIHVFISMIHHIYVYIHTYSVCVLRMGIKVSSSLLSDQPGETASQPCAASGAGRVLWQREDPRFPLRWCWRQRLSQVRATLLAAIVLRVTASRAKAELST